MFKKIGVCNTDYSDNILLQKYLLESDGQWYVSEGDSVGITAELSTQNYFLGNHSLKIFNPLYISNTIVIEPEIKEDYKITIPKLGIYNFCFRALLPISTPWFPELTGSFDFYNISDDSLKISVPFQIGNNSDPEFSFSYGKFNLFYIDLFCQEGDELYFKIKINNEPTFTAGEFTLFLDGFQLNYMSNRINTIPNIYSKPV